jgi:hypothetical protein
MACLRRFATAATAPQQSENRLLQTPPRNSLATVDSATAATTMQQPCNKAQQRRNGPIFDPRNSATSPFRGGETVAPLYPTRAPAAALCGAFASRCSSQPSFPITGQHQPMPDQQQGSSERERTGEREGGGIDLIVGSCVLISAKRAPGRRREAWQGVFLLARCVTAETRTRTRDSRRPGNCLPTLIGNNRDIVRFRYRGFIAFTGLIAAIDHPSHKSPHEMPAGTPL